MSGHALVEAAHALFAQHQRERLKERVVLVALEAQASARHLMRIAYARGERFGGASRGQIGEQRKTSGNDTAAARRLGVGRVARHALEAFVDDKVESGLGDAEVRGRYALVEAEQAALGPQLGDHLERGLGVAALVELHARLDEPDRIGDGDGGEAGEECRAYVKSGRLVHPLVSADQQRRGGQQRLGVGVREEVDGAIGRHADQIWPEALEERRVAFVGHDALQAGQDATLRRVGAHRRRIRVSLVVLHGEVAVTVGAQLEVGVGKTPRAAQKTSTTSASATAATTADATATLCPVHVGLKEERIGGRDAVNAAAEGGRELMLGLGLVLVASVQGCGLSASRERLVLLMMMLMLVLLLTGLVACLDYLERTGDHGACGACQSGCRRQRERERLIFVGRVDGLVVLLCTHPPATKWINMFCSDISQLGEWI